MLFFQICKVCRCVIPSEFDDKELYPYKNRKKLIKCDECKKPKVINLIMDKQLLELALLVRRMRAEQIAFFDGRQKAALGRAKGLEKQVDQYLKQLNLPPDPQDTQGKLL